MRPVEFIGNDFGNQRFAQICPKPEKTANGDARKQKQQGDQRKRIGMAIILRMSN